ncbi:MAG: Ig-like domain-containing protein, partial [Chloroflexi bacterium]|nr:Ig-like domain-containing protein [Chloroflexota bacterium]
DFADGDLSSILTLRQTNSSGTAIGYAATINGAKTVITLNPTSNLPEGAIYVAVTNGYYDAAGNQGTAASATFTVDATGPAAPTFSPLNSATVTDAGRNITLTFAEAVKKDGDGADFADADLSGILTLRQTNSSGTEIPYAATIDAAKQVITINPTSNLPEGAIYVAITNGYYDAAGNQGTAASATFTVDATAPSPTFSPASSASVTDAATNITLTFAEAVKKDGSNTDFGTEADLKAVLTLRKGGSSGDDIAYAASISADKTVITLDPTANLDGGTVYAAISNAYWDAAGNRGEAAEVFFNVAPAAPKNLVVAPGGARLDLTWAPSPASPVWYDVHYTSALSSGMGAVGDDAAVQTGTTPSAANGWVNAGQATGTSQAIIRLEAGTLYRVRVRASNAAGSSAWVTGMGTPTEDSTAPSATFSPANGEAVGDAGRNITLSFAEAIRSSAAGADFTASTLGNVLTLKKTGSSGDNIAYTASINAAKTLITIDPTADLEDGAVYVAIGNGYWDAAGNRGSAASATFTVDTTAPTVEIGGVPQKINSAGGLGVTFTFSEEVTGFVAEDVTVTGGTKGAFSGSGDSYTLAVTPSGSADVVVTVAANAATDGGNTGPAAEATATATWDAAAPTVTFSPLNSATVNDAGTDITLTFAEAIKSDGSGTDFADADLASILTLRQTDSSGTAIGFDATIDAAKRVITINPASDLPEGAVYVAISSAYYDAAGNQGSAASATFTVDSTAPAAPTFDPADSATENDARTGITLTFANAIKTDGS